MEVSKIQKFMPKAENDEENIIHPTEPWDLSGIGVSLNTDKGMVY